MVLFKPMKSDIILLKKCYPFDHCSDEFCEQALREGQILEFDPGDVIFPADTSGRRALILQGEAMVSRDDAAGERYRVCAEAGCYLDAADKTIAATELLLLIWSSDAFAQLCEDNLTFERSMDRLADGLAYQQEYLDPDTDVTDPVLCAEKPHWLVLAGSIVLAAVIFGLILWACGVMFRYYTGAVITALLAAIGTGYFVYCRIESQMYERLILTTRNLICYTKADSDAPQVIPLSEIESAAVEKAPFFPEIGRLEIMTGGTPLRTFFIGNPADLCSLLASFSPQLVDQKLLPPVPEQTAAADPESKIPPETEKAAAADPDPTMSVKNGKPEIVLHAHWAMLIKMSVRPLLFAAVFQAVRMLGFKELGTVLNIASAVCLVSFFLSVLEWRAHRFVITDEVIKDCSAKPLLKQDEIVAPLRKVQSVRYSKDGFFQVMLDYGTVYITAGEGTLDFNYVPQPENVQALIMERCKES